MKIIGKRIEKSPSGKPSAENLLRGALANEALQKLPTGDTTFIPRGKVYRFKTHTEADEFQKECVINGIAKRETAKKTSYLQNV